MKHIENTGCLADLQFPITEHLEPGPVDHPLRRPRLAGRNRYVPPRRPVPQGGKMRHGQFRQKPVNQARQKILRLTGCQNEQRPPVSNRLIAQPERHSLTRNQSSPVLRPVGAAIALLWGEFLRPSPDYSPHSTGESLSPGKGNPKIFTVLHTATPKCDSKLLFVSTNNRILPHFHRLNTGSKL